MGDPVAREWVAVTVGVICAIPQEWAYLHSALSGADREQIAQVTFDTGELDAHRVVLAAAGMGKVNTGLVATLMADRFRCCTIIFTGVAGGLDPRLHIGDIVIADRVVQHDFGVIEDERLAPYQPGHVPFINPTERFGYPVEPELIDRVKRRLEGFTVAPLPAAAGGTGTPVRISYGTVLTGDQYLHCESTRTRLHDDFGGLAIDMEGGALAQVCEAFAIPWLVIRALSDLAGADSGVDFNLFADEVAISSARILMQLLPVLS
ncbi:5'-methylthioadenosine/adenosylhomocysteine nucleosidase [Mycobacterium montefiorense]|uniref:5'-methylthioadenosine/adenosylhomocysteine nucleosidase n=1 Tax=Mycobacterium montefiorense TaxID=154654 RepID=UPI0021F29A57|nr:5'-methylthioadenosine/adenosylhomocysteine nucleosidase [Mycobacterium montefiorense]MCV7429420.1 5'-methylthioadenosine/adenosylhomocysteine nucleosidase [Mycobacterium montefiorense]